VAADHEEEDQAPGDLDRLLVAAAVDKQRHRAPVVVQIFTRPIEPCGFSVRRQPEAYRRRLPDAVTNQPL
jgi:hypothetical protein